MSNAELDVKFASMAIPVLGEERTQSLIGQCWDTANMGDAGNPARAAG
jgi:hypothetical protein